MGEARKREISQSGKTPKDDEDMSVEEIMGDARNLYERTGKADPAFKKMIRDMVQEAGKSEKPKKGA